MTENVILAVVATGVFAGLFSRKSLRIMVKELWAHPTTIAKFEVRSDSNGTRDVLVTRKDQQSYKIPI